MPDLTTNQHLSKIPYNEFDKIALERIEDAYQSQASSLALSLPLGLLLPGIVQKILELENLKELSLNAMRLVDFPTGLSRLQHLEKLHLQWNVLSYLPPEIGQLSQLKYLNLSENNLKELPGEIGQLKKLETLYLNNNALTELPSTIGEVTMLRTLYLHSNQLIRLPREILSLQHLAHYELYHNYFPYEPVMLKQDSTLDYYTANPIRRRFMKVQCFFRAIRFLLYAMGNTITYSLYKIVNNFTKKFRQKDL